MKFIITIVSIGLLFGCKDPPNDTRVITASKKEQTAEVLVSEKNSLTKTKPTNITSLTENTIKTTKD